MYHVVPLLMLFLLMACHTQRSVKADAPIPNTTTIAKEAMPIDTTMAGLIALMEHPHKKPLSALIASKNYLMYSVTDTLKIPDTVYYNYLNFVRKTLNAFNRTLYKTYSEIIPKLEKGIKDAATRDFYHQLDTLGLQLFMTEGYLYVDTKPDYFYQLFTGKLSAALTRYQAIRRMEQREGFSSDARMLISFAQLAQRIRTWEAYISTYPNAITNKEAQYFYKTYLETFLTGMSNSRVYDIRDGHMLPEIKALYTTYIHENTTAPSAHIVAEYYAFMERHDFTYNDSIPLFLKTYNLSSMLDRQPHLR